MIILGALQQVAGGMLDLHGILPYCVKLVATTALVPDDAGSEASATAGSEGHQTV
jgi:hypothetical protein